jgi:hypothetical protein
MITLIELMKRPPFTVLLKPEKMISIPGKNKILKRCSVSIIEMCK